MKKKKQYLHLLFAVAATACLQVACIAETGSKEEKSNSVSTSDSLAQVPLNLSVFLDLSDRIDSTKNGNPPVSQVTRDTAIIGSLVDIFFNTCKSHDLQTSADHFQVLFHPVPQASNIALMADNLNVDLKKITDPREKRKKVMRLKEDYSEKLNYIYTKALQGDSFIGSDIWGFFCNKNAKVKELCVRKECRNVLVVLTDGYIYHQLNMQHDGNAYSYILPNLLDREADLSLMAPQKDLGDLEVLMLEINPGKPTRTDKLLTVLETWLQDMGVKTKGVYETDMPSNTRTVIDNFFEQ